MKTNRLKGRPDVLVATVLASTLACSSAFAEDFIEGGGGTSYLSGPGLALAIPDEDPAGLSNTISIPDNGTISGLAVAISADHTWVGDLSITLTGPGGGTVTLADRPGLPPDDPDDSETFGDDSNISTTAPLRFFDFAGAPANSAGTGCLGPDEQVGVGCTRTFAPEEPLAAYNGTDVAGDWTLNITDNAAGDTGTLDGWALYVFLGAEMPDGVVDEADGLH